MKHIQIDPEKTRPHPDRLLRSAIVRAIIKHFKAKWEVEKQALLDTGAARQPGGALCIRHAAYLACTGRHSSGLHPQRSAMQA